MFIARVVQGTSSAPQERNVSFRTEYLAPPERRAFFGVLFYKHLVPTGLKAGVTGLFTCCANLRNRTIAWI
jgi:hypothetical protein